MPGVAQKNAQRVFANPKVRLPIPAEMPEPALTTDMTAIEAMLKQSLAQHGMMLGDVMRINIAFPQKHPGLFPGHHDAAVKVAEDLQKKLAKKYPHIEWRLAHEIYDTVDLDRSSLVGYFHALTGRQNHIVEYDPATPPPFARADGPRELFILTDWTIRSGTTMANLMSFIHHNGGHVLGIVTEENYNSFKQARGKGGDRFKEKESQIRLADAFNDEARNTGKLKEMAFWLCMRSIEEEKPTSPNACLVAVEKALNKCGNSLFALTDTEANGVMNSGSYDGLLKRLRKVARERKAAKPCP